MNEVLEINKTFFGKNTALRVMLNRNLKSIYIHAGKKGDDSWKWIKTKFCAEECGKIIRVLTGKLGNVSFFHKFKENATKIWVSRKEDAVFFRIEDITKSLDEGEQEVMRLLLEEMVIRVNDQKI